MALASSKHAEETLLRAQGAAIAKMLAGGELCIHAAPIPPSPDDEPIAGTQLWHATLSAPWSEPDAEGTIRYTGRLSAKLIRNGVARWFRYYTAEGDPVLDGEVAVLEAHGDLIFQSCDWRTDQLASLIEIPALELSLTPVGFPTLDDQGCYRWA